MTEVTANFSPTARPTARLTHVFAQAGGAFLDLLRTFEAARACAAAIETNHRPDARDLRILGIDPQRFAEIRLG